MTEGNACFCRSRAVAFDIAHIDRSMQMIPFHDQPDIGSLAKPCAARTFKICDTVGKSCFFEKKFDVSGLAVADDEERAAFGKLPDRICHPGVEKFLRGCG